LRPVARECEIAGNLHVWQVQVEENGTMATKPMSAAASIVLTLVVFASACASPAPRASSDTVAPPTRSQKKIVASIFSDPAGLHHELTNPSTGSVPGMAELFQLLDGSLTYLDGDNLRRPLLAETVPTGENGLWQVCPDGRMEMTWRLRPGIRWHDGAPMTADDLRFSLSVYRDRELGIFPVPGLPLISGIDTPDPLTAVVKWQKLFVDSDALFSSGATMRPLPKHLLEQPFQENNAAFLSLPFWREELVGTGPFRMQDWELGSHALLVANDDYVLGRPRLDQIEVRFFKDLGAIKAGLLAGSIDAHFGRGFNVDDVLQIQDRTKNVKVQLGGTLGGLLPVWPQLLNPDPPIVANLQFRRALLMAIDRQQMTDTINSGLGPVAHSWVQPDRPEGRAVEGSIVRHGYDPRAAAQAIENMGYSKRADGFFQAADGTSLSFQLRTSEQIAVQVPATLSVKNYWQQLGLDVQVDVLPLAQSTDLRLRSTYPSFLLINRGTLLSPDGYFNRSAIPLPETNFVGGNTARYGTAELDGLIERYVSTIPFPERMAVLGEIVHYQSEQVTLLPIFFIGAAYVLGSERLKNVLGGQVWNAHLWDLDL